MKSAPKRPPVVLTRNEVRAVIRTMSGVTQLVSRLLRLTECLTLRVKDLDFERNELTIRDGKGAKDLVSVLPGSCREDLLTHLNRVRAQHQEDLCLGLGRAPLPFALAQKYLSADREWGWQYVFPASSHYTDRDTGVPPVPLRELKRLQALEREYALLQEEHELLKKAIRFCSERRRISSRSSTGSGKPLK